MQDGVLDAANVLVDTVFAEPVRNCLRIKWSLVVLRVGVTVEIPRGIDERVHRVRLAASGAATFRTSGIQKLRHIHQRRPADERDGDVLRQNDGQILFRDGHDAVLIAIHHRNRRAPIALPRNTPVFQAEIDGCFPETLLFGKGCHFLDRFGASQSTERTGVHQDAFHGGEGQLRFCHGFFRIAGLRQYDQPNFQVVLLREFIIALIVSGHAHDGAGSVVHQNVVRDPHGHSFAVVGILGVASGKHAVFFDSADVADFFGFALLGNQLIDLRAQLTVAGNHVFDDGMLGRKLH